MLTENIKTAYVSSEKNYTVNKATKANHKYV